MMVVHFKAIEDTFLTMEQRYGIKLTDGLESFLVLVFNRIFVDQRLRERNPDSPCADIPFREEIFTDACKEIFPVYREGALEKECRERGIAFLEETERTFHKIREQLDREAQEDTVGAECQIRAESRVGLTRYRVDMPREELIRRGKWRFLQMALREWDSDEEEVLYCAERIFRWDAINPGIAGENIYFYTVEAVDAEGSCIDLGWSNLNVCAEVYDAFLREIFESYGRVGFSGGEYVLRIKASLACGAMAEELTERRDELLFHRKAHYPDVRAVYYSLMADCLGEARMRIDYSVKDAGEGVEELLVTGPHCLYDAEQELSGLAGEEDPDAGLQGHPYLNRKPHNWIAEGQTITYEEYKKLIDLIEEKYPVTLQWGDEEEHMKKAESDPILHPMGKSFMETVWCHTVARTPYEYRELYGPLERRMVYDAAQAVYHYFDNGRLEEYCRENDFSLPEIFRQELGIPEEKLSSFHVNHEELVRDGRKEMMDMIREWRHGQSMDLEDEFYLTNFFLMTSVPIEQLITTEVIDYYVMEPVVYGEDRWYDPDFHRLYIPKFTYDGLMRTFFEELVGYRMSGDRYHLTISQEGMEFLLEKRISREIRGAKYICGHPECEGEEYDWYKTIWLLWEEFVNYVKTVYQAYGAGRPELALYGPFHLPEEKLPLRYRQFLLDCWNP